MSRFGSFLGSRSASLVIVKNTKKAPAKQSHPTLSTPNPRELREAKETSARYKSDATSSNATKFERQIAILASAYAVIARGVAIRLPDVEGESPVYNRAWRPVRSALSADEWSRVKVCAVYNGMFSATATEGTAYLVPKGTKTTGQAPAGW